MAFLAKDDESGKPKICPSCGSEMVLKDGRSSPFWGCSTFPKCKKTAPHYTKAPTELNRTIEAKTYGVPAGIKLSPQQEAIQDELLEGCNHLIIEARAGCAKTTTIAWTLPSLPINMRVGFCAFSRHISEEIRSKVPPHIRTFTVHSMGLKALGKAYKSEVDENKVDGLLDEILRDEGVGQRRVGLRESVTKLVSLCKATLTDPNDHNALAALADKYDVTVDNDPGEWGRGGGPDMSLNPIEVFNVTARTLKLNNERTSVIDPDDMVYMPVALNLVGFLERFEILLVDEAQDLNMAQQKLIQMACPFGRLVLVGDKFQSIFGFRAADIHSMGRMERLLRDSSNSVKVLKLTQTLRCPKSHIRLAQQLVPDIEAVEGAPEGVIEINVSENRVERMAKARDMILCRTNAPLVQMAYALIQAGKPCIIRGRDIAAGLESLVRNLKAQDMTDLEEKLKKWASREKAKLMAANKMNKMQAVTDKVETLFSMMAGCDDLSQLRARIDSMFSDSDNVANKIILSSVHAAKGLEAVRVFILRPDLMPHPMSRTAEDRQQEEHILYVAITRSKEYLAFCGPIPELIEAGLNPLETASDQKTHSLVTPSLPEMAVCAAIAKSPDREYKVVDLFSMAVKGNIFTAQQVAKFCPNDFAVMVPINDGVDTTVTYVFDVKGEVKQTTHKGKGDNTYGLIRAKAANKVWHDMKKDFKTIESESGTGSMWEDAMMGAIAAANFSITVEKGGYVYTYIYRQDGSVADTNDEHGVAATEALNEFLKYYVGQESQTPGPIVIPLDTPGGQVGSLQEVTNGL